MNEAEKERLIKKDIVSIENRVRHAFNQGYEMGLKESRSENPNTCGDAISRQAVMDYFRKWQPYMATRLWDFEQELSELPSVSPQQRTGRWIAVENDEMKIAGYYCSECDLPMETENQTRFCPNCGAKMEVEE